MHAPQETDLPRRLSVIGSSNPRDPRDKPLFIMTTQKQYCLIRGSGRAEGNMLASRPRSPIAGTLPTLSVPWKGLSLLQIWRGHYGHSADSDGWSEAGLGNGTGWGSGSLVSAFQLPSSADCIRATRRLMTGSSLGQRRPAARNGRGS